MKKSFMSLIMLIATISMVKAEQMQDLPALSRTERFIRGAAKWGSAGVGAVTGAVIGGGAGAAGGYTVGSAADEAYYKDQPATTKFNEAARGEDYPIARGVGKIGANVGSVAGAGVGTVAGYKGAGLAGNYILAKIHGVSYRMEMLSQFYDINLGQYGRILIAAESKSISAIDASLQAIFPKRFGQNWRRHLATLFKLQARHLPRIISYNVASLSQDEADFLRMVEIGAAMANLYFGSTPSKKTLLENATRMYKELKILQ